MREELIASYGSSEGERHFAAEIAKLGVFARQWEGFCRARQLKCFSELTAQQVASLNAHHHRDGGEEAVLAAESELIVHKAISSLKPRERLIIR